MRLAHLAPVLSLAIVVASCDKGHHVDYIVDNATEQTVRVEFPFTADIDSTSFVAPFTRDTIDADVYFHGTVGGDDSRQKHLPVTQYRLYADTTLLPSLEEEWEYTVHEKFFASYVFVVE